MVKLDKFNLIQNSLHCHFSLFVSAGENALTRLFHFPSALEGTTLIFF